MTLKIVGHKKQGSKSPCLATVPSHSKHLDRLLLRLQIIRNWGPWETHSHLPLPFPGTRKQFPSPSALLTMFNRSDVKELDAPEIDRNWKSISGKMRNSTLSLINPYSTLNRLLKISTLVLCLLVSVWCCVVLFYSSLRAQRPHRLMVERKAGSGPKTSCLGSQGAL